MTIENGTDHLSLEVRAAIDAFMHKRRRDRTPVVISEVVEGLRRAFPDRDLPKEELANAIVFAAMSSHHAVHSDKRMPLEAIADSARWNDDGGSDLRRQSRRGTLQ